MIALRSVCDIIKSEMGLPDGSVYIFNQKTMMPKGFDLFVCVQILSAKPFGVTRRYQSTEGLDEALSVNMMATLSIDIMSRGTEALERKEEVILALASTYSQNKQIEGSFKIADIPSQFTAVSTEDGAAIPYRFNISVNVQYSVKKGKQVEFYDHLNDTEVLIDP